MRTFSSSSLQRFLPLVVIFFSLSSASEVLAQAFKEQLYNPEVNFYDIVQSAEAYFEQEGSAEGSGRKGYERWKFINEPKYYPSGDRSQSDFFFASRQYRNFLKQSGVQSTSRSWTDLGPYQLGKIRGGYSPGLGRIETFYIDPTDTLLMYFGSRSGGFWKTTDGGVNWQSSTTDTLVASGVNTLAVNTQNSDSILINVRNADNGTSHGIYRSIDGGDSWSVTPFNPSALGKGGLGSNFQVFKIKYHPNVPHKVYVGTSDGLYISTDDMQTFTQYLSGPDITDIAFHPTNSSIIYAYDNQWGGFNENRILRSTDGGQTFTASSDLTGNGNRTLLLSVSPDCSSCVYAASTNGVYRSLDEGQTFQFLSNPNSSCDGFAVNDLDTSKMIYGYLDTYSSADGGRTFNQSTYWSLGSAGSVNGGVYIHADLREAAYLNGTFYGATDGFLVKTSNDGQTWKILSFGTGIRENYMVGVSQSDNRVSICGSQDNGTSVLTKGGWVEYFGADGMEGVIHPLNPNLMLGSYQFGGRIYSANSGFTRTVNAIHNNGYWEAPLLFDPNDPMKMYSFGEDIFVSEDFGKSWQFFGNPNFNDFVMHAAIAQNNSNVIAVTNYRLLSISQDGGQTFAFKFYGLPNRTITDVTFAPGNDSIIAVTFADYSDNGQKIYITFDQGQNWQNITGNLGDMPIRSVAIDHTSQPNIYVGAEIGVYVKPLNGGQWQLFNTDLPNCTASDIEIMRGSNTLRAATWGRGLWETKLLGREDYPSIERVWINDAPSEFGPRAGIEQPVYCSINYAGTIQDVYLKWSTSGPSLDSTIAFSLINGQWESDRPLPAIAEDSVVFFQVFAVGNQGDTSETYRFMYRGKPQIYCPAEGASGTGADWISEVRLANLQHSSNKSSYSDFTGFAANLNHNQQYTLEVQLNFSFAEDSVYAWIDYDNNFHFSSDELIRLSAPNSNHLSTAQITTPAFVGTDTLRMRVRVQYDESFPSSCGDIFGEVEDYSIILTGSGIGESEPSMNELMIYPNPAKDIVHVTVPVNLGNLQMELIGISSQSIRSWECEPGVNDLSLESIERGMYFLKWNNNDDQGSFKLIVE